MHAQTLLCATTVAAGSPGFSVGTCELACTRRPCCAASLDSLRNAHGPLHTRGCACCVPWTHTKTDVCVAVCVSAQVLNNRAISATSGCIISLSGIVTWHLAAFPAELWQGGGCLREHFD